MKLDDIQTLMKLLNVGLNQEIPENGKLNGLLHQQGQEVWKPLFLWPQNAIRNMARSFDIKTWFSTRPQIASVKVSHAVIHSHSIEGGGETVRMTKLDANASKPWMWSCTS